MRISESQIKKIVQDVKKLHEVNQPSPIQALERLNAAFTRFMDDGGNTEDLLDNAQGFIEDWESGRGSDM